MTWSEAEIARALVSQFFGKFGIVCPNCYWTGYECDLLVVHHTLRLIDVEIKVSRSDLKIDREKDKWWRREQHLWSGDMGPPAPRLGRDWPPKVWKHYYVLPADVWKPELVAAIPPFSGVLTIRESHGGSIYVESVRRVTANRGAAPISAGAAMEIARLVNARYWQTRGAGEPAPAKE